MYNANELFTNSDWLSLYMDFGNNGKLRVFTDAPISMAAISSTTVVAATRFSLSIVAIVVAATALTTTEVTLTPSRSIFVVAVGIGLAKLV